MHRADAGAGEHGVRQLGDHRQVDADPVTPAHAVMAEHVGHPADLVLELAVGDLFVLARLVLGPDDGHLVAAAAEMSIHAVEAGVQPATEEPTAVHLVVIAVEHRLPRMEPGQPLGLLGPECLRVVQGEPVQPFVFGQAVDVCLLGDVLLGWENSVLVRVAVLGHGGLPDEE